MGGSIRIGISGWRYPPWRRVFYPKNLPQRTELQHASRQFSTIEINGSFYSLQRPASYAAWYGDTPDDFVFAVKGGRFITHLKRLRDVEAPLANFFASGVLRLGRKLGPILWQLPPNFVFDPDRLDAFFRLLPRTARAAAQLGRRHDERMRGRVWLKAQPATRLRHALEVRHPSFESPKFIALLRKHRIAAVVADTAGKWPLIEDVTADFLYLRLHGDEELYASGYDDKALERWAKKIASWARGSNPTGARTIAPRALRAPQGRDVFVYFDNDVKVHAPFDAASLARRLNVAPPSMDIPTRHPARASRKRKTRAAR